MSTPKLEQRPKQRYAAIRERVSTDALGDVIPRLLSEVYRRLGTCGIDAVGGPLVRYLFVDYGTATVEIDVGVPIAPSIALRGARVRSGVVPSGTFVTLSHRGSYARLAATTARLLVWGRHRGLRWQVHEESRIAFWRGRVERYLVGPPAESNRRRWRTEIAILIARPHRKASPLRFRPRTALGDTP